MAKPLKTWDARRSLDTWLDVAQSYEVPREGAKALRNPHLSFRVACGVIGALIRRLHVKDPDRAVKELLAMMVVLSKCPDWQIELQPLCSRLHQQPVPTVRLAIQSGEHPQ